MSEKELDSSKNYSPFQVHFLCTHSKFMEKARSLCLSRAQPDHQHAHVARRYAGNPARLSKRTRALPVQLLARLDSQAGHGEIIRVLRKRRRLQPLEFARLRRLPRNIALVFDGDFQLLGDLRRVFGQFRMLRAKGVQVLLRAAQPVG